jgi:hypothetical protein
MIFEGQDFRGAWRGQLKRTENWEPTGKRGSEPLEVTDPDILQGIKDELDYIFNLNPVKKSMEYADKITIGLQRGEESKKGLLSHTPRNITIDNIKRDNEGNIVEKTLTFQRENRYCKFIISTTPEGEKLDIGENNLDSGYNNYVLGWTKTGIELFKKAVEQNDYTPVINVEVTYSDTSTPSTDIPSTEEQPTDVKGPMEI